MNGRQTSMLAWLALLILCRWELVLAQSQKSRELAQGANAAASFSLKPEPAWTLESDNDGIIVYSRKTEGSSIREVLAETTIPAPLERVLKAIEDYRNYPEFMPYVEESTVLAEGDGMTRLFLQLGFPPPISDRYYTIVLHRASDPLETSAILVRWDVARDDLQRKKGNGIEVTINRGGWRLQSDAGAGATRVLYYVHTDPGGILPSWAINIGNTVAVPKVIMGLKKKALSK
jgi:hypothetical protein